MRQRNLFWAGVLILTGQLLSTSAGTLLLGVWVVPELLLLAALILLAMGWPSGLSITSRRPFGTSMVIGFGLWHVGAGIASGLAAESGSTTAMWNVTNANIAGSVLIAIIAATQIARFGPLPRPWSLFPAFAIAAYSAVSLLGLIIIGGDPFNPVLAPVTVINQLVVSGIPVVLGVSCLLLAGGWPQIKRPHPLPQRAGGEVSNRV